MKRKLPLSYTPMKKIFLYLLLASALLILFTKSLASSQVRPLIRQWDDRQEEIEKSCKRIGRRAQTAYTTGEFEPLLHSFEWFEGEYSISADHACSTNLDTTVDIVIHHTAIEQREAEQLQKVNRLHRDKGYNLSCKGYYVGYHFFIGTNGDLVQTRCLQERSLHTRNEDVANNSIGIALAGNFNTDEPTKAQMNTLEELISALEGRYEESSVIGHRHASPTQCPGEWFLNWLEENYETPKDHHVDTIPINRITSYNPEVAQNDAAPCIGSVGVDICHYRKYVPIVALSQDLVNKAGTAPIQYGQWVKVHHETEACNYEAVVLDVMNARYTNAVDIFRLDKTKNHGLCSGGTLQALDKPGFYELFPEQLEYAPKHVQDSIN